MYGIRVVCVVHVLSMCEIYVLCICGKVWGACLCDVCFPVSGVCVVFVCVCVCVLNMYTAYTVYV